MSLEIFDVTGRLVRKLVEGPPPPGPQEVAWDGRDQCGAAVPNGLYFYRLTSRNGYQAAKELVVMK